MGDNIFKMENANELITRIYKELLKSRRTIQINAKMGLKPEQTEETQIAGRHMKK